ncbi:hypothetical protein SDC9_47670 [bioreactor metagenome]|uniref:Uncharacterized protein n=1 Tax=bioreactor metagenome TaxID=1076179 RepID=A0A644WCA0_9ZZZZ
METLVFDNENKRHIKCHIFDCEDHYELRTAGNTARFSKNNRALNAVIDCIKLYGNPQSSPQSKMGFAFRKKKKPSRTYEHVIHLSHVLFATYTRKPTAYYLGRRLCYIDGDENNLTKENIRLAVDYKTSIIEIDRQEYTVVTSGGMLSITNYSENLHQIIENMAWQYDKKSRAMKNKPFGKRGCYLHQLIWAYHNRDGVNADNWRDIVFQTCSAMGGSIDHKKTWGPHLPRWDNRIENLQLIPKRLNSLKSNCTKSLPTSCFYLPTTGGEIYGRYDYMNSTISVYHHTGDATADGIAALKQFCKTGKFSEELNIKTYKINTQEGLALLLAELHENKLYQEVFDKCLTLKR